MSDTTEFAPAAEPPAVREEIESPQDRLIDTVTASQQEAIDSAESAGTALVEGMGLMNRALADFVSERVHQGFETQQALLRCRSFREARTIGFAHVHATVDQYGHAMSRMVRLGTTVAQRSLERPRHTGPRA